MATSKPELRKLIATSIAKLTTSEKQTQSSIVYQKLVHHREFKRARQISVYLSTANEIDTIPILRHAFESGKRCFIPFVKKHTKTKSGDQSTRMVMVELESINEFDMLPYNNYGIKEPSEEFVSIHELAHPKKNNLDFIIVPGVAFARNGKRLGHGKGYYDEFLTDWLKSSDRPMYSIGLAFKEQIVNDPLAVHGKDFVLDEVLTA